MAQEPLLTTPQVAKQFSVDPATVRRWAVQGYLPASITPGGFYRFRRSDVEAVLRPLSVDRPAGAA